MRKHIICKHDDKFFWFEYRAGGRAVVNEKEEFESIEEFCTHYDNHNGPLFAMDHYLQAMELAGCFGTFQDLSGTKMSNPVKELADQMMTNANRLNLDRIAEHHHKTSHGLQALVGAGRSYDQLQKEYAEEYQGLFDFFVVNHGLILTEGEMDDVVHAVKEHKDIPDIEIGVTKRGGWIPFLRVENQTFYIQYESSDKKEVEWMADNLRTAINKLL